LFQLHRKASIYKMHKPMKTLIGYHCSLERYTALEHLTAVKMAASRGFKGITCSDHFYPWSVRQGASIASWPWLGSAMSTVALPFGVVTSPTERCHPLVVAQYIATLASMYEGRLWVALGSGQLLNEHITNHQWPVKSERNARLKESIHIIKKLLEGQTLTFEGKYFQVYGEKLFTLPSYRPKLVVAALSNESAYELAGCADGIITVVKPAEDQKEFIYAYQQGGGDKESMYLQAITSYHENQEQAEYEAWYNWRHAVLGAKLQSEIRTPADFDSAVENISIEQVKEVIRISSNPAEHLEWLQEYMSLGFAQIYIQDVSNDQISTIDMYGRLIDEMGL
jgi:F420-dependent oxidoreductase, G6PDH family